VLCQKRFRCIHKKPFGSPNRYDYSTFAGYSRVIDPFTFRVADDPLGTTDSEHAISKVVLIDALNPRPGQWRIGSANDFNNAFATLLLVNTVANLVTTRPKTLERRKRGVVAITPSETV
jgi:hypothetical protein